MSAFGERTFHSDIIGGDLLMPWAGLQKLRAWQVSVEDSHFERPVMTPQYPRLEWPCVHKRLQVETSGDGIFHFEMIEPLSGILGREQDISR